MNAHEPDTCPTCARPPRHPVIPPRPAPARTPELARLDTQLETAERNYADARKAWENAARDHHTARSRGSQSIVVDGWQLREVGGVSPAELATLGDAEQSAQEHRDQVGADLVEVRMAHRAAVAAARAASAA